MISLLFLALAIGCYSVSQLLNHRKFKYRSKNDFGFWGKYMDRRKYKNFDANQGERWPTSTTLTVMFTDSYHLMQFFFFIFLTLSFSHELNWWEMVGVYVGMHLVHAILYRTLQR